MIEISPHFTCYFLPIIITNASLGAPVVSSGVVSPGGSASLGATVVSSGVVSPGGPASLPSYGQPYENFGFFASQ